MYLFDQTKVTIDIAPCLNHQKEIQKTVSFTVGNNSYDY